MNNNKKNTNANATIFTKKPFAFNALLSILSTILVTSCDLSDNNDDKKPTQVIVFGDSLSDAGTYANSVFEKNAGKFIVNQSIVNGQIGQIWVEYVANSFKNKKTNANPALSIIGGGKFTALGCTDKDKKALVFDNVAQIPVGCLKSFNFAQGGAKVSPINLSSTGVGKYAGNTQPASIGVMVPKVNGQCPSNSFAPTTSNTIAGFEANADICVSLSPQTSSPNAGPGFYVDSDLNDSPNVFTVNGQTGLVRSGVTTLPVSEQIATFLRLNGSTFQEHQVTFILAGANELFTIASIANSLPSAYLQAGVPPANIAGAVNAEVNQLVQDVATRLITEIQTNLLNKGAKKVVIGLLPDLGKTPLAVVQGPSAQGLFTAMTVGFNQALMQTFANNPNVVIVDTAQFFSGLNSQTGQTDVTQGILNQLSAYGFTNGYTATACRITSPFMQTNPITAPNKKSASSLACNMNDLTVANADQTYAFADLVHPTAKIHYLLSQTVTQQLKEKKWLD